MSHSQSNRESGKHYHHARDGKSSATELTDLSTRLKRMGYIPQNKRRSYIPKPGNEKGRPLAISVLEDKIVESVVKRVLRQICEFAV